jgi:hypothetical protein
MWKSHDEHNDHALFHSNAREELRFILTLSSVVLGSVCVILAIAIH